MQQEEHDDIRKPDDAPPETLSGTKILMFGISVLLMIP